MLPKQSLQLWFSHVMHHMRGFVQGAVFDVSDANAESSDLLIASAGFQLDKLNRSAVNAVLKRRKAVVQKLQTSQLSANRGAHGEAVKVASFDCSSYLVCCPVFIQKQMAGVVCVEMVKQRNEPAYDVLDVVEDSVRWLISLSVSDLAVNSSPDDSAPARLAVEFSAISISHCDASSAASALTSRMAHRLGCERVSVGYVQDQDVRVLALSNSAGFEPKQNIIKRIEAAIREAADQYETLVYPARKSFTALQAHGNLASQHGSRYICTVPIVRDEKIIGGMCFERGHAAAAFNEEEVVLLEQLVTLVGSIIDYRRRQDHILSQMMRASKDKLLQLIVKRGRPGRILLLTLGLLLLVALLNIDWRYRISANAVLEGAVERVVTAPEAGYIKTASVRPGDLVKADQMLASLDDRDLQLEKLKWTGKRQQVSREYREALAGNERSQIGILHSQLEQAETQLAILDKKLQRTVIAAPISGVIVSGDFTRALGSPVEKGQVLYQVSPLDDYRVVLNVDEADVAGLAPGMKGELTLNAAAEDTYRFTVSKITPVSRAENGTNYFQVEATLDSIPEFLRPGMQGVGKIEAGERRLLWIWTHNLFDWIRLKLWAWW
jgi:RND family efflux transporter MFP subunit